MIPDFKFTCRAKAAFSHRNLYYLQNIMLYIQASLPVGWNNPAGLWSGFFFCTVIQAVKKKNRSVKIKSQLSGLLFTSGHPCKNGFHPSIIKYSLWKAAYLSLDQRDHRKSIWQMMHKYQATPSIPHYRSPLPFPWLFYLTYKRFLQCREYDSPPLLWEWSCL